MYIFLQQLQPLAITDQKLQKNYQTLIIIGNNIYIYIIYYHNNGNYLPKFNNLQKGIAKEIKKRKLLPFCSSN